MIWRVNGWYTSWYIEEKRSVEYVLPRGLPAQTGDKARRRRRGDGLGVGFGGFGGFKGYCRARRGL